MEYNRSCDFTKSENDKKHLDNITHIFDKHIILLNTYIYIYLMKYFKKIRFFLNSDEIKKIYICDLKYKIEKLYENLKNVNNNEQCKNDLKKNLENQINTIKNNIIEEDSNINNISKCKDGINTNNRDNKIFIKNDEIFLIFENVDKIIFDTFLLVSTNDENIKYPYNLVKLKIEIYFENLLVNIYSSECILIDKKWDYDLNTLTTCEKYNNIMDINKLEITFKKNSIDEKRNTILNHLVNHINMHSLNKEKTCENGLQYIYNELFQLKMLTCYDNICDIIKSIDDFFYLLLEPDFYNFSIQKVNKICYKNLYDQYNNVMIKSKTVKLNNEMIEYLLSDSIFLPNYVKRNKFKNIEEHLYSSFSSYSECSSSIESSKKKNMSSNKRNGIKENEVNYIKDRTYMNDKKNYEKNNMNEINNDLKKNEQETESSFSKEISYDESCENSSLNSSEEKEEKQKKKSKKKKMRDLFDNKEFRNILEKIKKKIEKLNNSVFLRVNYKNLKSGSFVNNNTLEVNTLYDALLILKSSTSIYKILKENKNEDNYLILSKYVNINICFLFEVYVYNKEIIAISQKYLNYYFDFLKEANFIIDTINLIKSFYEKYLKNSFPCDDYILQLYIHTFKKTHKKKIFLINAKNWLFKNKHPIFTNTFLKHYIYTGNKGIEIKDEYYNQKNIYKFISNSSHLNTNEIEQKEKCNNTFNENVHISDFFQYDNILYYCIMKNDSIYKKNFNIYPKDLNYIKEGEIDIDNLMDTMKKENNIQ
ncbi:regulator of initiation factor 2, putative [Plasmodium gallinaceum]|uniref:Regulator of initiation factor 2, putative n=1 Tax=Plasmodium gallinaceum TaxID=5849 RepID=A0A1J1GT57_PLAGA|nr:regulator of initiation factor 2, putative [Plasmodium gallinaceum]CRG94235.1 regulator of initiation factor 2, putative [Plasmodium gallinaceum]